MSMQNLLKNPQTNWKYILIVVVLALLAGGGILAWSGTFPSVPKPTPIPAPPEETMQIKLYFGSLEHIQQQIDCESTAEVTRTIPKTEAVAQAAIEQLIKAPTAEEKARGLIGTIPSTNTVKIRSLKIENKVAYVDFYKEGLNTGIIGASCGWESFATSIDKTLKQFPSIEKVEFLFDGKPPDFF